jgi:hypothetical protein
MSYVVCITFDGDRVISWFPNPKVPGFAYVALMASLFKNSKVPGIGIWKFRVLTFT